MRRLLTLAALLLPIGAGAADTVVQEFHGAGLAITRPITVSGPWEVQWNADGFLQIMLQDEKGQPIEPLANQQVKGPGSSYVPRGGTFIIQFNGLAPWTAKVVLLSK